MTMLIIGLDTITLRCLMRSERRVVPLLTFLGLAVGVWLNNPSAYLGMIFYSFVFVPIQVFRGIRG